MNSLAPTIVFSIALALILAACGGAAGPNDPIDPPLDDPIVLDPGDPSPQPADANSTTYYVDVAVGDDANLGSSDEPFKTITYALDNVAEAGDVVQVRSGTYTETTGEVFPLVVGENVTLVGNVFYRGKGLVVSGSGLYQTPRGPVFATVVPGPGSRVVGFTLRNYADRSGFVDEGYAVNNVIIAAHSGVTIRNCKLRSQGRNSYGIGFTNDSTGVLVDGCDIRGASHGLVFRHGGGSLSVVQGTTLTENGIGASYTGQGSGADLGRGAMDSGGGNTLSNNYHADLAVAGDIYVSAQNNIWDGRTGPSVFVGPAAGKPAGIDVFHASTAEVDTAGARYVGQATEFDPGR